VSRISGLPDIRRRISAKCRISGIRLSGILRCRITGYCRILPDTGFSEICPNLPKFCPNFAQICRNYPVIRQLSGKKTGYPAGYPAIIRQKTDIRLSGYPVSGKNLVSGYPVSGKNLLSGYPVSGKKSLSGTPLAQTPKIGQKLAKL
jgi:hypothetical protein